MHYSKFILVVESNMYRNAKVFIGNERKKPQARDTSPWSKVLFLFSA